MRPLWQGLQDEFEEFGSHEIPKRLSDGLRLKGIYKPSNVQEMAYTHIAGGDNVLLEAPTGSGKTFAYLMPLVARLQPTLHVGVQALVLVPTAELALQFAGELKWLIETVAGGPNANCWFNPQVPANQACEVLLSRHGFWDAVKKDTSVLVSTPGVLLAELRALQRPGNHKWMETCAYYMGSNLDTVVIDEVDTLCTRFDGLNRSNKAKHFKPSDTERVVQFVFDVVRHRYRNRPVQLISGSATSNAKWVHRSLQRLVEGKYPKRRDAHKRKMPILLQDSTLVPLPEEEAEDGARRRRMLPPSITNTYAPMDEPDDRFASKRIALAARIASKLSGNLLLVVPHKMRMDAVVMALRAQGIMEAVKHKAAVRLGMDPMDMREDDMTLFEKPAHWWKVRPPRPGYATDALQATLDLQEHLVAGGRSVLVAKAESARGIDLDRVTHVIILSPPNTATEYMHIAGRTGRRGRPGTAITIVDPGQTKYFLRMMDTLAAELYRWDISTGEAVESEPLLLMTAVATSKDTEDADSPDAEAAVTTSRDEGDTGSPDAETDSFSDIEDEDADDLETFQAAMAETPRRARRRPANKPGEPRAMRMSR